MVAKEVYAVYMKLRSDYVGPSATKEKGRQPGRKSPEFGSEVLASNPNLTSYLAVQT